MEQDDQHIWDNRWISTDEISSDVSTKHGKKCRKNGFSLHQIHVILTDYGNLLKVGPNATERKAFEKFVDWRQ
jgi:hypothetical protein